ncbi:MAG: hypothetical protein WCJ84_05210 [Candidatus Peregrinibacteria bacterium]
MANVISEEDYLRQYQILLERFQKFQADDPENERFLRMGKNFKRLQNAYSRHPFFVVRQMRAIEKYHLVFQGEQRSVMIEMVELLKKLLWEKKLSREKF